jgi:hypothetical protein
VGKTSEFLLDFYRTWRKFPNLLEKRKKSAFGGDFPAATFLFTPLLWAPVSEILHAESSLEKQDKNGII